eukprot:CAMPEP_0114165860 /NCGR_PEP_ID=MMETSP0043_2-20121206/31500_1 /TAXON_ID=464988 /ORGANISM="Hemiselmis andersenii, Strain CCMP644" /LENGTH=52 /DNA_ID=CAMNT_0001262763 /DNA_START=87 /DNA_END=242 /DNA_ORIENTATION=-
MIIPASLLAFAHAVGFFSFAACAAPSVRGVSVLSPCPMVPVVPNSKVATYFS